MEKYQTKKAQFRGRGQEDKLEKRTISTPQHQKYGIGQNEQGRQTQRRLQQVKRSRFLQQHARTEEEDTELTDLERKLGEIQEDEIQTLQETLGTINKKIQQHRATQWNQWIKDHTAKPKKVFD